jgi:hypothetical protein
MPESSRFLARSSSSLVNGVVFTASTVASSVSRASSSDDSFLTSISSSHIPGSRSWSPWPPTLEAFLVSTSAL